MTSDLGVKLIIEAENRATSELQKIPADVERLRQQMGALSKEGQASRDSLDQWVTSLRKVPPAAKETKDALKETTEETTRLSTAVSMLSSVVGGSIGVAIGNLASMLAKDFIDAMLKARKELEAWNAAMESTSVDLMTKAIQTQTQKVLELGQAYNRLQGGKSSFWDRISRFEDISGDVLPGALAAGTGMLATGQLRREQLQLGEALNTSEGDAENQGLRFGEWRRKRQEAADRLAAAQRQREIQARQNFLFGVARRQGQAALGEIEATYRQSELADQGAYKSGEDAQERALRSLRASGQAQASEYEATLKQSERADEAKFEADKKREDELFRYRAKKYEELRDYLEETDIFAGLDKGFRDMARGAGEVMQDFAKTTARGMQQSFDDLFFNAMTGQFKKMGDFGRQAGYALARSFSGALSELLVGGASRGVSGLLRGGVGGLTAVTVAGGGTALVPSSAVAAGAPIGAGGVAGATSGGGLLDLLVGAGGAGSSTLAQFFGLGGGAAAGLSADLYGGAANLAGITAGEGAGFGVEAAGTAAGIGGSLAGLAGPVLAGVGFLAALYGAYTTRSPGMGAVSGGVSGLVAGATIGSVVPWYGTLIGGAVGLIAGAALGAGAGALGGKGNSRRQTGMQRSQQNLSLAVQNFSAALNQAQTGEDIINILNRTWSNNAELVIVATAGDGSGRFPIRGAFFGYGDLFDPAILASIEVRAGVSGAATASFELTQALKSRLQQIAQAEGGVLFAQRDVAAGITRTTYQPFAAIAGGSGAGQPFYFSTEDARSRGASDVQFASMLRYLRSANATMDLIPDLTAERFLQL